MSSYKCNFCDNNYGTKKSLNLHQKTAKFCLEIQKGMKNNTNVHDTENDNFLCEYCDDKFTLKSSLERHYNRCKFKEIKNKDTEIESLKNTIKQYEKLKDSFQEQKEDNLVLKKELNLKDEFIQELKKEIESLKNKVDDTYMTLLDRSDKTYNTFIEKEEKLVNTLLYQNSSSKNTKSVNNSLTINNYGIKPLTTDSLIEALEAYNTKNPYAFNGYQYDGATLERGSLKLEFVFYGIVKELRDYYGITDVSREKIVYNYNGELTLTTMQEFIRTNIVMNNIDAILEWIENLQVQIEERIIDGVIDIKGEERMMTEEEKSKLKDKKESLNYVYKIFKGSKDMGTASMYLIDTLREEAMKVGKVVGKTKIITKQLSDSGRDL